MTHTILYTGRILRGRHVEGEGCSYFLRRALVFLLSYSIALLPIWARSKKVK